MVVVDVVAREGADEVGVGTVYGGGIEAGQAGRQGGEQVVEGRLPGLLLDGGLPGGIALGELAAGDQPLDVGQVLRLVGAFEGGKVAL